ncbi:BZ3500_MvSof-1268-A1-R1_Chr9g10783 [Microbotryum saponariae]|uniref:BZ3500_MvSof-1268-A1-R1_Chr9g10783 protein n=1 Tax=Microbotryum saponariae TaxID=289078 RepID=A0A2X0KAM7_9BASI|nr:BZ3501_MvSof-1269-A2-R1_Chr9g10531 [Microbotryum saponariae]SDA00682.1 BZ3500_MvSof-1268-A1-R1_Chr9g10783 [Microbotryum saponariae]
MAKKERIAQKEEASNQKKKAEDAKAAAAEEAEWSKGAKGKGKGEDKAAAAAAAKARKEEAARLLAEEEASIKTAKAAAPKAGAKKAGAGAKPSASTKIPSFSDGVEEPTSFSATGIDDALDMLSLVTERTDKAYVGAQASSKVDSHPERRYKAAFEAYKANELPQMKKDYPGLRLQQYNERLYDAFKKHPDNPFNQLTVSYDATKEDKVAALKAQKEEVAKRYGSTLAVFREDAWLMIDSFGRLRD